MTRTHRVLLRSLTVTISICIALSTVAPAQERPVALSGATVHTVSGKPMDGVVGVR